MQIVKLKAIIYTMQGWLIRYSELVTVCIVKVIAK